MHGAARTKQTNPDALPAIQPSIQFWPTSGASSGARATSISQSDAEVEGWWAAKIFLQNPIELIRKISKPECKINFYLLSLYFRQSAPSIVCLFFQLQLAFTPIFILPFHYSVFFPPPSDLANIKFPGVVAERRKMNARWKQRQNLSRIWVQEHTVNTVFSDHRHWQEWKQSFWARCVGEAL